MRKALYVAVVALVGLAPWVRAQSAVVIASGMQAAPMLLVIQVPEPAFSSLLPIDLLFVAVLVYLFRRKASAKNRWSLEPAVVTANHRSE